MQKRIKGASQYFNGKYGTPNPTIEIEGKFNDVFESGGTPFEDQFS